MSTSTRYFLPTLAVCVLSAAALHAAPEAPAPAAAAPKADSPATVKAEAPAEPYQLKNRSAFNCPAEVARVPFWPIGWSPRKGAAASTTAQALPKVALDDKMFRVTSILLGTGTTGSLAVINGRAYSEGENLRMPRLANAVAGVTGKPANSATRIRVLRITDGTVLLQRDDETITVALQRPELAQRKPEEPLLDEQDR
jgi:hypothetical protein